MTKPDLQDNLNKAFFDALEGVIYEQDQNIVEIKNMKKYYSDNDFIRVKFVIKNIITKLDINEKISIKADNLNFFAAFSVLIWIYLASVILINFFMGIDFEWITGFAIGIDYLEDIEVKGFDSTINLVRVQLDSFVFIFQLGNVRRPRQNA